MSSKKLSQKKLPAIAAHRGLAWRYPPNSMIAFEAAAHCGATYIELDFRVSSDGQLVCFHDKLVDRYVEHQPLFKGKAVSELSLAQLLSIDVNELRMASDAAFANTVMPTLEQVLCRFANKENRTPDAAAPRLMIEHKAGTAAEFFALLVKVDADLDQLVVMSFDFAFLNDLRAISPVITLAMLGAGELKASHIQAAVSLQAIAIHWSKGLTALDVVKLHDANLQAWMYTLNDEIQWHGAIVMGLDVITTDRCDMLATMLDNLSQS